MPRKRFARILRPAPRGSKLDWRPLTFQLPPDLAARVQAIADDRPDFVGNVLREAVEEYLSRRAA